MRRVDEAHIASGRSPRKGRPRHAASMRRTSPRNEALGKASAPCGASMRRTSARNEAIGRTSAYPGASMTYVRPVRSGPHGWRTYRS